jgi:hypothetical protein
MRGDNCVIQTNGHDHAPFLASLCWMVSFMLLRIGQRSAQSPSNKAHHGADGARHVRIFSDRKHDTLSP